MDLRIYLKNSSHLFIILNLIMLFVFSGCISTGLKTETSGSNLPEIVKQTEQKRLISDSRSNASQSLTIEGYNLLSKKDFNGAIRLLERAVGVNPSDGPGYYYLAEAWIGKKNYKLAFQFNRLATIYLRKSDKWSELTTLQKKRIKELQ